MADLLPFEALTAEERRTEREENKRLLMALDWSSKVNLLLAEVAESMLDVRSRLEDFTLQLAAIPAPVPDAVANVITGLRQAIHTAAAVFGKVFVGARYDCEAATEVMSGSSIPAVSGAQLKAIKAHAAKKAKQPIRAPAAESILAQLKVLQKQQTAMQQQLSGQGSSGCYRLSQPNNYDDFSG